MKKLLIPLAVCVTLIGVSCKKNNKVTATCDGSQPTYNGYVAGVISGNCAGCHGPGSSNGDYSTYSKLSSITNNGTFEKVVLTNQTMPQSGSLSQDQLNKLKCWVENGFPEN